MSTNASTASSPSIVSTLSSTVPVRHSAAAATTASGIGGTTSSDDPSNHTASIRTNGNLFPNTNQTMNLEFGSYPGMDTISTSNACSTNNNISTSNSTLNNNSNNTQNSSNHHLAKGGAAHTTKLLPLDYKLGDDDVICGRGSRCFNHTGNKRFRKIVCDHLSRYSTTVCKFDKTSIICEIVALVRLQSPTGGFVKKDTTTGRYYEVGDFLAVRTNIVCRVL